MKRKVAFCMFGSIPEPPTLNALSYVINDENDTYLIRSNLAVPVETYPAVPKLIEIGEKCSSQEARKKGVIWKTRRFLHYLRELSKHLKKIQPDLVVPHDYLALLAVYLCTVMVRPRFKIWFNSYDVLDPDAGHGRFSLIRIVSLLHKKMFSKLDYFSLPAMERLEYYPIDRLKRKPFVVPNYPSLFFYRQFRKDRTLEEKKIKLIYQGALGKGHGFEEIIDLLPEKINDRTIYFSLKGWIDNDYKKALLNRAKNLNVESQFTFFEFGPYREVPEIASQHDIGLAIFTKNDVMNKTLGTASNKIYEYAALGLPVILYDNEHFRSHLGNKKWAYFTDLSKASLKACLANICANFSESAQSSISDFEKNYNFEKCFGQAFSVVSQDIGDNVLV